MKIEAKWDWVVIDEDRNSEQGRTEAGVIIPGAMSETVRRGTVVAIGIGKCLENGNVRPMQVEVGDYVLYQGDVGHIMMHGAKPYRIVKEEDIVCAVVKE